MPSFARGLFVLQGLLCFLSSPTLVTHFLLMYVFSNFPYSFFIIIEQNNQLITLVYSSNRSKQNPPYYNLTQLNKNFYKIQYYFLSQKMRQGKNLLKQSISEWRDSYIDYQYLKAFITVIMKLAIECIQLQETLQIEKNSQGGSDSSPEDKNEQPLQAHEIQAIKDRIKEIKDTLEEVNKLFIEAYESEIEECRIFCIVKQKQIEERLRMCILYANIFDNKDRKMLNTLTTFMEYTYIQAAYLKKMEEANIEAERKILKKHKKYAQKMIKTPTAFLEEKIDAKRTKDLIDKIQDFYVIFCNSIVHKHRYAKRKIYRDYLRSLTSTAETSNRDSCIFGLWLGIFLAVIIFMALLITYQHKSVEMDPIFNRDFPTWRGIAYIIFYLWILGLNVHIFENFSVSHRNILDFNEHHYETSTGIFKIAGFLSTVFAGMFTLYALTIADIVTLGALPPSYLALIVWGFFIAFVFNPFPIFYYKSRIWTIKILLRIIVSPLVGAPFVIVWATDQLLSLITPFEDLAYTICYYTSLDFTDKEVLHNTCRQPARVVVFAYATIIFIYRMLQCMKQGYDKRKYWKELQFFNTIKYLLSLITLVLSFLWKGGNQNIFAAWLTFAIASTLYSYIWDLKIDWALLERKTQFCLLRDKLTYPYRSYYFMMIINLLLRLAWVLTLSPNITERTFGSPQIFRLVTGALQIIRRGIWNLLRIQKEHLKKCSEFQALPKIRDIHERDIAIKLKENKQKMSFPTAERIFDYQLPQNDNPRSQNGKINDDDDQIVNIQVQQLCLMDLRKRVDRNQKKKKQMRAKLAKIKTVKPKRLKKYDP